MSGYYAIDGGTISVEVLDPSQWKSQNKDRGFMTAFVGTLQAECGSRRCTDELELAFYEDSGDDVPIVSIKIPPLYRDRFFSYIAGACSATFFREIKDKIDAEEDEEEARPHEEET